MPTDNVKNNKVFLHNGTINKVDTDTKSAVLEPIVEFRSKSPQANKFMNNVEINIASNLANVKQKDALGNYCQKNKELMPSLRGFSLWEPGLPRAITMQEAGFASDKVANAVCFKGFQAKKEIRNATMHEVGHQFDSQFGFKPSNITHQKYKAINQY